MIPCSGLEQLVYANGIASFPFSEGDTGQVSNAAFSAPPRHPALLKIINFFSDNPSSDLDHVLYATGPNAIANALQQYNEEFDLGLPNVHGHEAVEKPLTWAASGDVRIGRYTYTGPRVDQPFYFYHAAFASWIPTRADFFESSCESEEKLHLIKPFIMKQCEGDSRDNFSTCGKDETAVSLQQQ